MSKTASNTQTADFTMSERATLPARLLAWYDRYRRVLPWRAAPGAARDPYRVWLSEIMLQQTTVATVGPYFTAFLARWPTVEALAAADLDAVLHAWQGLGYYARARNLHKCARVLTDDHGGRFPDTEAALRRLPGIGPYTAAAIAAIAFDRPASPVDGNIERIIARLRALQTPLPDIKPDIARLAAQLTPDRRPGDYVQALMDLGATLCTPRSPDCPSCPLRDACAARSAGLAESLPRRRPKTAKPQRHGVVFWTERHGDGAILLRRRPENGLLGGLYELPSTPWEEALPDMPAAHAPAGGNWRALPGTVRHVFTHFRLHLTVWAGDAAADTPGVWCLPDRLGDYALPTVMKKVVAHARQAAGRRSEPNDVQGGE